PSETRVATTLVPPPARSGERPLSGGGLGSAPPAGGWDARHLAGAVVAEVGLLRAAARVGVGDAHHGALCFVDFLAAVVANEHGLSCHEFLLQGENWWNSTLH